MQTERCAPFNQNIWRGVCSSRSPLNTPSMTANDEKCRCEENRSLRAGQRWYLLGCLLPPADVGDFTFWENTVRLRATLPFLVCVAEVWASRQRPHRDSASLEKRTARWKLQRNKHSFHVRRKNAHTLMTGSQFQVISSWDGISRSTSCRENTKMGASWC